VKKLLVVGLLVVFCALTACAAPKNVIFMIGDGMGFEHVAAGDYYVHGGEKGSFDWMTPLAMSTYSANGDGYDPEKAWSEFAYVKKGATDSAASGTALSTGVKTTNGRIGIGPEGKPLRHMYQAAEEKGKATGVVTSVLMAHATPAAFSAHNEKRSNYEQISREMITQTPIDVLMGTGHPEYDGNGDKLDADKTAADKRYVMVGGKEVWAALRNGSAGADADGDSAPDPWAFIDTREEFQALGEGDTPKRLLGLARVEATLQQERDGDKNAAPFEVPFTKTVPTLAEMVKGALNVLDNDPDGLFLMIEGGAIDWTGHDNQSGRLIEEQLDFCEAVNVVREWVEANSSWDETLLVVTADHETGYLTGPADGEWAPVENRGKGNLPGVKWNSGSHTNSLVPLFVKGAGADAIVAMATSEDPRRGKYMHSTVLSQTIHAMMAN